MDKRDSQIDRLLRAASAAPDEAAAEMPFGFDTRVLAAWRAQRSEGGADFWEIARIFRRVAVAAAVVTVFASGAAFWQMQENDEYDEPTANAYAIADSVIEAGAFQ